MAPLSLGLDLMGRKVGVSPIFWAPFNDPSDPLKVYAGGPLTMVRATDGTFLNPKTGVVEIAADNILRIQARGALIEGQRTNVCLQSRDFDTTWDNSGGVVLNQDAVGIDGVSNAAWTAEDDSVVGRPPLTQTVVIDNNNDTHCFSVFVGKDNVETRFPEFHLVLDNGTDQLIQYQINTKTGEGAARTETGTVSGVVEDFNALFWRVILTATNNTSGNTSAILRIYPAASSSLGGVVANAIIGSIVIDATQLEVGTFASSYIPTTDAAVTRNADDLTAAASGNIDQTVGSFVVHVQWEHGVDAWDNHGELNVFNRYLYKSDASDIIRMFDGSTSGVKIPGPLLRDGSVYGYGIRWGDSANEMSIFEAGALKLSGAFDGNMSQGSTMGIGGRPGSGYWFGHLQDFRIWNVALSNSQMIAKTA